MQRLSKSDTFEWTTDVNKALAFRSKDQADAMMMALRQLDRDYHKGALFAFEASLGNARPVEHGWTLGDAVRKARGGAAPVPKQGFA